MAKAKATKVAIKHQDETPVPELFLTELETLKKVRIKDGWGNTAFFIKGEIPIWVKDVNVGELSTQVSEKAKRISQLTIQEIVTESTGTGKEIEVETILPVALLSDDRFYIAVQCISGDTKLLFQRVYFDYILQHYPTVKFYFIHCYAEISKEGNSAVTRLIAKLGGEVIALLAPITVDSVKVVSPEELLTLFKEWSVNGINSKADIEKYCHNTGIKKDR